MTKRFLFVTANVNETTALLEEKEFFRYAADRRSTNPNDDTFYNIGMIGKHEVIHFELISQGSVKSGAAFSSVLRAIQEWEPDAVILLGIAFGKDSDSKIEPRQHIGDVLISKMIQDYESAKITNGDYQSDGVKPESGKTLISVFMHHSQTWDYKIDGRKVKCETGLLLSGDKVVDDADFKRLLFRAFPRAIGGEMEGRGAYSACREERLDEWIVVKAICDWGECKENPQKQQYQIDASRSVVSLLKHIFSKESAFDKLPNRHKKALDSTVMSDIMSERPFRVNPMGYVINIGTTSCRLLELIDRLPMNEIDVVSYDICDPLDPSYLEGIIGHVKNDILPKMQGDFPLMLQKAFVDHQFNEVFSKRIERFGEPKELKNFIRDFYDETNLYFNILSQAQTKENLQRVLGTDLLDKTAVINIGSHCVDLQVYLDGQFSMYNLAITLADVKAFVKNSRIPETWNKKAIEKIQRYIIEKIGVTLSGVKVDRAFILKDELKFMQNEGYPLRLVNGHLSLSQLEYKNTNYSKLFTVDYKDRLSKKSFDKAAINRLYGFKYGHILIETILDIMENKRVIPKNDLSIHGCGVNAYIFNIVISGSTHENGTANMFKAAQIMKKLGVQVTSPSFTEHGDLAEEISSETEYAHLQAIDECDVLFVCNKENGGGIGESTKCEIYYAYALRKTIAFWQKPPEDKLLSFIPREHWDAIKSLTISDT